LEGKTVDVSSSVWAVSLLVLLGVLALDFVIVARNPREPSIREATLWVTFYIGIALLFGVGLSIAAGGRPGGEFFAGWLTEYSLSVDNLFIFLIIMSKFSVPKEYQQKVLLSGVALALMLRGVFIALGSQAISRFDWVFYIFGAFLIFTAWKLAKEGADDDDDFEENRLIQLVEHRLPATKEYHGTKLFVKENGKRLVTPMLIVILTIGTTDLLFALDSIPAIFGLTQEPYIVFTANAFALMGLRQLYFLVGGLLDRLVYLSIGLAFVLGFIGFKLIFETLHHHGVAWAPEIPILVSLGVIMGTLTVTAVASLAKSRGSQKPAEDGANEMAIVTTSGADGEAPDNG
jgi:tellurite resistance protein TerC